MTIGQIGITVSDLDRAVPFYRDQLGLPLLFRGQNVAFFDCDGVRLMLAIPEANQGSFRSVVYFNVEDIGAKAALLRSRGVVFEDEPRLIAKMPGHDLWMAFFRDPDENRIALISEKKRL